MKPFWISVGARNKFRDPKIKKIEGWDLDCRALPKLRNHYIFYSCLNFLEPNSPVLRPSPLISDSNCCFLYFREDLLLVILKCMNGLPATIHISETCFLVPEIIIVSAAATIQYFNRINFCTEERAS